MKTKFLVKLFLLALVCVSMNSCTADEITPNPKSHTGTSPTAKDGDPLLTNPK